MGPKMDVLLHLLSDGLSLKEGTMPDLYVGLDEWTLNVILPDKKLSGEM